MNPAVSTMTNGATVSGRTLGRISLFLLVLAGILLIGQGAVIPVKAALAQVLLDQAFSRSVSSHAPIAPWPWADSAPIARITVPRLNVKQIVLSGGSGEAMAFGPTLMPGSAKLGGGGTAVLAAHRDTHFRFLEALRPGDVVVLEGIDGGSTSYRVSRAEVLRYDRFGIDRRAALPKIALTTCWPFDSDTPGPWRYVVTAGLMA